MIANDNHYVSRLWEKQGRRLLPMHSFNRAGQINDQQGRFHNLLALDTSLLEAVCPISALAGLGEGSALAKGATLH
jgi:hypothetical protein